MEISDFWDFRGLAYAAEWQLAGSGNSLGVGCSEIPHGYVVKACMLLGRLRPVKVLPRLG